jgi:hypothetical protein
MMMTEMDIETSVYNVHLTRDDDDRDGHRNVGIQRTPNAADSPRRLYQDTANLSGSFIDARYSITNTIITYMVKKSLKKLTAIAVFRRAHRCTLS